MDLVVRSSRLPKPGETISGVIFFTTPGGKGANQAVACARLGAPTRMIGRVGEDVFGNQLLDGLRDYGVDTHGIAMQPGPSGVAFITVVESDEAGEQAQNTIVIVAGANGTLDTNDLIRLDGALEGAAVLLLQLEVPLPVVLEAARRAHQRGVTVILDPAPAYPLPPELYTLVNILTPNETEAATLIKTGQNLTPSPSPLNGEREGSNINSLESAQSAAGVLLARGVQRVIIKMGGQGVYAADAQGGQHYAAFSVQAVDTVAAGDAFNGALAVALAEGKPFEQAIRWGLAAGAISVTRAGAQTSMPSRLEVLELLRITD